MPYASAKRTQEATEVALSRAEGPQASSPTGLKGLSYEEGVAKFKPPEAPVQMKEEGAPAPKAEAEGDKAAAQKEKERSAAAEASWEKLFGETVGGWLFGQVREHVSPADLLDYGKEGTKAMADAAGGIFSKTDGLGGLMDTDKEAEALNKMLGALGPKLQELVDKWLESESGKNVLRAISHWVDEHPLAVVSSVAAAAIGAAVAAYCANVDVPEIKQMFKLGAGFEAGGSIDLGKIQELTVQAATLTVKYQRGKFNISLSGERDKDGQHSGTLSVAHGAKIGASQLDGKGKVKVKEDGTVELEIDGGMKTLVAGTPLELSLGGAHTSADNKTTVKGGVVLGAADGTQQELSGEYDAGSGAFKLRTELRADGHSLYREQSRDADGGLSLTRGANFGLGKGLSLGLKDVEGPGGTGSSASFSGKNIGGSGLDLSAGFGTGTLEGGQFGLAYKRNWLSTKLDLSLKPGASTLSNETTVKNDGFTAGVNVKLNLTDSRLQELGMKFGYEDPKEFRGFLASYKRSYMGDTGTYSDDFDLRIDATLGDLATRFEGEVGLQGGTVMSASAGVTAGYPLGSDFMLLGGLGYSASMGTGALEHDPYVGVGLQYKDVGLMMNYHPMGGDNAMLGLQIVLPLGRR